MANGAYLPNRFCSCARCRLRGLLGPTLLITIGVLMLFSELHVVRFHYTWPIILIVIGVFRIFQSSTPTSGHQPLNVTVTEQGAYYWTPPPGQQPPPAAPPSGEVHNG
jgi:hypothetical protein